MLDPKDLLGNTLQQKPLEWTLGPVLCRPRITNQGRIKVNVVRVERGVYSEEDVQLRLAGAIERCCAPMGIFLDQRKLRL